MISATNTPFESLIDKDRLRADFFHRIAHSVIQIPPLRERRADIPELAQEFVGRLAGKDPEKGVWGLSNEARAWLSAQPWPGNVRELEATVERGYAQAKYYDRSLIQLSDLQRPLPATMPTADAPLSEQLQVYELSIVSSVFAKNGQYHSATARELGIDRKRLKRILARAQV